MITRRWLITSSLVCLTACGGSNTEQANITDPVAVVPDLNAMTVPLGSLVAQQGTSFERHLKNGVFLRSQTDFRVNFAEGADSSSGSAASSASTQYSATNSQELGVDEGDRIKYDGQYLFIATQEPQFTILADGLNNDAAADEDEKAATSIRIMQRQQQGNLVEANTVVVNEEATNINALYLNNNVLAVLSDIYSYNIAATFAESFFPTAQTFNLSLVDVVAPQSPNIALTYTIDGAIVNSRRIGDMLYVVSAYSASLDDIVYAATEQEKLDNYNKIMQTDINQLLPKYRDGQGNEHNLVDAQNCYLPENTTELDGFDGIVTLTAISLSNPSLMNSVCINAQVQGLYASQNSLYLYGTEYQYIDEVSSESSVVHKFNVTGNDISYRASGNLDGRFNWNLSNLRFSEQGNYLRVVTTTGDGSSGFIHKLNVLSEDGNELSVVSQLPNTIHSKLIGKVSDDGKVYEDIQAVRYYQNQAYIVTFENTDPLYVIDLKDNTAPVIAGELEIPGYSAYLHPISENLLLGVGQNVQPRSNENAEVDTSPIVEGAKVSLFDISDMSTPKEIHSLVYADAYTPVEFDYHALTFLTMPDHSTRFAVPIERWLTETITDENDQKYDVWSTQNELALFEVTGTTQEAQLIDVGKVKASYQEQPQYNSSGWLDRSVMHGDDIYYIHGHQVWQSVWSAPSQASGPY